MSGANQAVSGGIGGFLAFFLLACALWLLMRNMNKRLRNVKYDEELEQQRHAVEADQETVTRPPRLGGGAARDAVPPGTGTNRAERPQGAAPGVDPDDPVMRRMGRPESGGDALRRASARH